ncbi:MAG TPA: hypothetical protein VNO69_04860 [Methyloceanibacter sp.]|nr:hypothetical protein [Methyloceanibacter sp.]
MREVFDKIGEDERITRAKDMSEKVLEHFIHLAALHENNGIVVFSPTLASQIPRSYAANAFHVFQHAMYDFELIRLCALWDCPGNESDEVESIPTVIELIDHPRIIDALTEETRAAYADRPSHNLNPSADPELRALEEQTFARVQTQFAEEQALKARRELTKTIANARTILKSSRLAVLRNHRDKYLVHSLSSTRREKKTGPISPMKYGRETDLLAASIPIIEKLYCWVNGCSFHIEHSQETARRHAGALWNGCTFKVER